MYQLERLGGARLTSTARHLNVPSLFIAVAGHVPDRLAIVHRGTRLSFADLLEQANQVAHGLAKIGLGSVEPRASLPGWLSGQDHVAIVLRNGPEYLEAMLGAFIQRAVPFNVNFRYTAQELADIFADARPAAVVVHDEFAEAVADACGRAECSATLIQVPDGTGRPLADGALAWGDFIGTAPTRPPRRDWSPDDVYMLYTGGTTGRPKGVLWRQADAIVAAFNVVDRAGRPFESVHAAAEAARSRRRPPIVLPAPPFMHGAAQWLALGTLMTGGQVVIQDDVIGLNPPSLLDAIEREGVTHLAIVGDAFARPLAESLEAHPRDVPTLRALLNGGAALSDGVRDRLLAALPHRHIFDSTGSSESGREATREFTERGAIAEMAPLDGTVVVSEDRSRCLDAGDEEVGWLARSGHIPLGYLRDETKTRQTFPVITGCRYVVPGDRARLRSDGTISVLGRDSTTINTGGEKVYAEEVEAALVSHPAVRDAVVVGRPSERWGHEVVAVVSVREPLFATALIDHAGRTLARYKLPKEVLFVAEVPRTPAGKADRRAAQAVVARYGLAAAASTP